MSIAGNRSATLISAAGKALANALWPPGQHFPELVEQSAQGVGLHDAKLQQLRA
jgi:hypothetical protein